MARKKPELRELTAAERARAEPVRVYVLFCKHLDPSLDGDGSDHEEVALFLTEAGAREEAERLQKADPDGWNAYGVRGPVPLLEACGRGSSSPALVRRLLDQRESGSSLPIRL